MKRLSLLLCSLAFVLQGHAQIYPIRADVHLSTPWSPYLTDYTLPASQRLTVQLYSNDQSLTHYPSRLRIAIEGIGISIRTRASFSPDPLHISAGEVQTLSGEDLKDYFHPDALDITGLPRSFLATGMRLPEGVYKFSVEVVDYYRGTVVSNTAAATLWITLNDPPLLNTPAHRSVAEIRDPANILFSWTPRHTSSPNSAFTTQYDFRLVEVRPADRNPYDAMLTQRPLFEVTTDHHQLLYGAGEPPLIPGETYAWQVTARDTEGRDLFKNQGASEVFVFRFGDAMPTPKQVFLRWAKPTTLAIRWTAVSFPGDIRYRLQYRERKTPGEHPWHEHWTRFTDKTLYHLKPNTEYEVRIRAENNLQESPYSPIERYKTLPPEATTFVCHPAPPPPLPDKTLPVFPLSINDTLRAGGFDVLIRDVVKTGSKYSGSGVAIVPWFNDARVEVTFEKIGINDSHWLTSGVLRTRWKEESKSLLQQEKPPVPGQTPAVRAGSLNVNIVSTDTLITVDNAAIVSVTRQEDSTVLVITSDGQHRVLDETKSYSLIDATGNGYVVDEKGNIAKTSATAARASAARGARTYDLKFAFRKGNGQYGFDHSLNPSLQQHYEQLADGSFVPWKALSDTQADLIEGDLEGSGTVEKLRFRQGDTPVSPMHVSGNTVTLNLTGRAHGWEEELVALYAEADTLPPVVAGKVNTVTYHPKSLQLEIIPVNDATMPGGLTPKAIADYLNTVYGDAVVSWSVEIAPATTVDYGETLDAGSTNLLSNYTAEMKAVFNAFGRFQPDKFYLFLVDESSDPSLLGYMPRSRQAGFVFTLPHRGHVNSFLKTIAHELGHGAFNLKHTFDEYPLPPGSTDNLMDYGDGTVLNKNQWDQIHNPGHVVGLFEGQDAGTMAEVDWWERLPPYKKAAEILKKHLKSTRRYKQLQVRCDDEQCVVTGDLVLDEDIVCTMDVTFQSHMTADELLMVLISDFRVDLWQALNLKAENVWDELYHWWRKQNDDLAQQSGWQVDALTLLADVIAAPTMYPAIKGWITGKHWLDGRELTGWDHALAAVDFLAAEELVKAYVTKFIVRVGKRSVSLLRQSRDSKRIIKTALEKGLKITVLVDDEITILATGSRVAGKIVNNVLTLPYPGYGGRILCEPGVTTTVIGKFDDLVSGNGIRWLKENKLYEYGKNSGGINILDAANWSWELNEKWLREAVARGDVIRVVSDPRDLRNLYKQADGYFVDRMGRYITEAEVLEKGVLTTFGEEVKLMARLGKKFNHIRFVYE